VLGLNPGLAPCRKELFQPFILEAADHMIERNPRRYGLQHGWVRKFTLTSFDRRE
jgi:hypothetical protein